MTVSSQSVGLFATVTSTLGLEDENNAGCLLGKEQARTFRVFRIHSAPAINLGSAQNVCSNTVGRVECAFCYPAIFISGGKVVYLTPPSNVDF